jgi:hypothetical protein
MYPSFVEFKDGSKVYLNLPKDASDYLNVYINGVLFKSVRVADGHAEIRLDGLAPGRYILDAKYMGKDYDVADISSRILVSPKITVDGYFRVGEKKFIKMEVPKKCRGRMIVDINGKKHTVRIKNGKAVFSLKKLKIGEYDVDVTYIGDDGFKITDYFFVEVVPAKIKIRAKSVNVLYKHKEKYRVKVFGRDAKVIKNGMVKFKIAKRTFKAKTDRRGIAEIKLPVLKLKTYKIKVSYKKAKETRKVKVGLVKTHRITKSGSKLKLKATLYKKLRSKTVTFKFMGKKYKSKTNSKGIAQVLVKNPKTAKKLTYTARYAGRTAKQH